MSKTQFTIRCRVLVLKEDKILVVKHHPEATFYALPGGHMEAGENPLECMKREIMEELGVDVPNPELKYTYKWIDSNNSEQVEFFFLVRDSGGFEDFDTRVRTHAFEIVDMKWIDKNDDTRILPGFVMQEFRDNGFEFEGVRFVNE
jgi:8-oxo-dGTP pyrophosphatase MutT (NUDIX family)